MTFLQILGALHVGGALLILINMYYANRKNIRKWDYQLFISIFLLCMGAIAFVADHMFKHA